jgi:hypothetical protein
MTAPPLPEVFPIGLEEPAPIDLSPAGGGEFETSDDSPALLDWASGKASEFQQPNPAEELRPSGTAASEYQSPSGAEELLSSVDADALASAPGYLENPPPPPLDIPTSGFAAIALMPTEEMPTTASPEANAALPLESDLAPAQSVVEMLAAASDTSPAGPPASVTPDSEPAAESAAGKDLHLIFPDDATEPEPPRVRRITEEIVALGERESAEAPVGEPEPVVTETMAELYARQGHLAEALNVYRVLAARAPNDSRLVQRIGELEALQSAGGRRMSYVAVDTGGESVESFFRSLSDARPAGAGEQVHSGDDSGGGAPTRPASDAVSLSAIFGDEGTAAASPSVGEPPAPRSGTPDSFSFDQFFGGGGASPSTGPRQAMPSDEDLDQFQNWLKSLKR